MKISAFIIIIFLFGLSVSASQLHQDQAVIDFSHDRQLMTHRVSNIEFSITNYGVWGYDGSSYYPSDTPSAEFPKDSDFEYLYRGYIWIGATVDDEESPGVLDTTVSVALDGWWGGVYELNPSGNDPSSMWRRTYTGDDEIHAEFYDTLVNGAGEDPIDQRPHLPLGLKINQVSSCWSTPGYDEFFIIEYTLENIYNRDLHDVWFGINYLGEVYYDDEDYYNYGRHIDELRGYIDYNGRGIGWIADNDGDPYEDAFRLHSPRGIMGLMLISSSAPDIHTNYNWWISNANSQIDWGPQLQANYDGPFPGGGKGTPGGDRAKYKLLSRPERDYDQAYSALDWTDNGWIANDLDRPWEVAEGAWTRFLLSYGPFDLAAGQVETLTFAYFAGHDFHVVPNNYEDNLHGHTDDSSSIANYYDNLNFSDFLSKADTAVHYYNDGIDKIPIGPPTDFQIAGWSGNEVELSWSPREHPRLAEYRIYRGTQPGIYSPRKITPDNFRDTVFADTAIEDNTIYYYIIKSVNNFGIEGGASPVLTVNSGQPRAPVGLVAHAGDAHVELSWQPGTENDIAGYIIRCGRFFGRDVGFSKIDTATTASYSDYGLRNGILYDYAICSYDSSGSVSYFSDMVYAIPHEADLGLLLINANETNSHFNPDYDSMAVFYNQLLLSTPGPFAISDSLPMALVELAGYQTVVWCCDMSVNQFSLYFNENLFREYLMAGGNLILAGPRIIRSWENASYRYFSGGFEYDYLNLENTVYPDRLTDEFIGGTACLPQYPDFGVDTSKANRVIFPLHESDGRLCGLGTFLPRDTSEIIYSFRAINPDTSKYHGRPLAIIHHGKSFNTAVLNFPLYYVEPGVASAILSQVLQDLGHNGYRSPSAPLPERTSLVKNYPNPFNPATSIEYELAEPAEITINIYDILGRRVTSLKSGPQGVGMHSLTWDAEGLPSGVYFARLTNQGRSAVLKMLLLK